MSLFDSITSAFSGQQAGSGSANASTSLVQSVMEHINNQPGGLNGLIQQFREKGVGDIVSSWVSNGQNLPISSDQLSSVLGSGPLAQIAEKAGITPDQASSALSQILPHVVNHATPDGAPPEGGALNMSSVLGSLGSLAGLFGGAKSPGSTA
jgi:uncharacterized protein YidB (DUF937 family)